MFSTHWTVKKIRECVLSRKMVRFTPKKRRLIRQKRRADVSLRHVLFRYIRLMSLSNKYAFSRFFYFVKSRTYFSFFKKIIPIIYKKRSTRLFKQIHLLSLEKRQ